MAYKCMFATIRVLLSFALIFLSLSSFAGILDERTDFSDETLLPLQREDQPEKLLIEPVEIESMFSKDGISDEDIQKVNQYIDQFRNLTDVQKVDFLKTLTKNMDFLVAKIKSLKERKIRNESLSTEQGQEILETVYNASGKVLALSLGGIYTAGFIRYGYQSGELLRRGHFENIRSFKLVWMLDGKPHWPGFITNYSKNPNFIPHKSMHYARAGSWGLLAVGTAGIIYSMELFDNANDAYFNLTKGQRTKLIQSIEQRNQDMKRLLAIYEALSEVHIDIPVNLSDQSIGQSDEDQLSKGQIGQVNKIKASFELLNDVEKANFLFNLRLKIEESISEIKSSKMFVKLTHSPDAETPGTKIRHEVFEVSSKVLVLSSIALGTSVMINKLILNEAATVGIKGSRLLRPFDLRLIKYTLGFLPTEKMNTLSAAKNIGRPTALGKVARVGMFSLGVAGIAGLIAANDLVGESMSLHLDQTQRARLINNLELEREKLESLELIYSALADTE